MPKSPNRPADPAEIADILRGIRDVLELASRTDGLTPEAALALSLAADRATADCRNAVP